MITVDEALSIVLANCPKAQVEQVSLGDALGRILAEEVRADRDSPPFDRVTMDGIAIWFDSFEKGNRDFRIEKVAPAGSAQINLKDQRNCVEVMTGAMLPLGTDTVIRYEDLTIENGRARVNVDALKKQQNVHFQGSDRPMDSLLLSPGKMINAPELGVLATCGKTKLKVFKTPKVAIISSGDELVEVDQKPLPHQIRRSNNQSIKGALSGFGIEVESYHLIDNEEIIKKELDNIMSHSDVLILSGGVSMGKYDFIPGALEELKVKKLFHKVKQRPGKPFWFGISEKGQAVFALPGNPVSSFMCTNKYVLSWLRKHLGLKVQRQFAVLDTDITFKPDLNYFAQVRLEFQSNGKTVAFPIEGNGSGDLANLTEAHAFMELPRGKLTYKSGESYEIFLFNTI